MALDLGELFLTLGAKSDPLDRGLKKAGSNAGKEGKKGAELYARAWLGPLKAVGGAAVGLFAVSKVTGFFKDSIAQARDSNKIGAITTQVIKTTGGAANLTAKQIGNMSTALSMKTGVDDEVIQSGQNMLLTFKNVRNEAGKGNDIFTQSSGIMTDMSVAMGTDTKSAAIQLGKALNDPVKGVTALTKVGVTFDAAQKKSIAGYVKAGNTLAAQKIILKELKSEFGGAAAAAATPAQRLAVVYGNLKENIGNALIPIIDKAETLIVSKVIPTFSAWFAQIDSGRGTLGHVATVVGGFVTVLGALIPPLLRFGAGIIRDVLPPLVAMAGNVARTLIPALQAVGAWILTKLLPALRALAAAFITDVLPLVKQLGAYFVGTLLPIIMRVADALGKDLVRDIKSVTGFLREHKTVVQSVVVGLAAMLGAIYLIRGAIAAWTVVTKIQAAATAALDAVMDANPIMLIVVALIGLAAAFVYAYKHSQTFRNIVQAVFSGVMAAVHAFVGFFTKTLPAAFDAVIGFIKRHWWLLPGIIFGPLGLAVGAIIHFRSQIISTITSAWHSVSSATSHGISVAITWIKGLPGRATLALVGIGSTLYSRGSQLLGGLASGAASRWKTLWSWIKGIPGKIGGAALGWATSLLNKGGALIQGLMDGVVNKMKGIGGWVKKTIVDPIVNWVKNHFGIHSPSTVFHGIGLNMVEGLVSGLVKNHPEGVVKKVFGSVPKALAHMIHKGVISAAHLPGKALSALKGLGSSTLNGIMGAGNSLSGKLFGTNKKAGHGTYKGPTGGAVSASAAAAQSYAKSLLSRHGWGPGEMGALTALWNGESGWNNLAANPTSSAFGIAQFLDSTWGSYGPKTNDYHKQVEYGEDYIAGSYGTPSNALGKWLSRSPHWYDHGGVMPPGGPYFNGTGKTEMVRTQAEEDKLAGLLSVVVDQLGAINQAVLAGHVIKADGTVLGRVVTKAQKDATYGRRIYNG